MTITASSSSIDGYEPVEMPERAATALRQTVMFRRQSTQPSRRAVLHVQAVGDAAVPADVPAWFTERAFHFYVAGLRLPGPAKASRRRDPARLLGEALDDLDAACGYLRDAEGMASIVVTAQGRGALAAALWRHARAVAAADALILHAPELPARSGLSLDIDCPVLVISAPGSLRNRARRRVGLAGRSRPELQLAGHVTWLRLPVSGDKDGASDVADRHRFFDELGRWLGAYMYGRLRDQLL